MKSPSRYGEGILDPLPAQELALWGGRNVRLPLDTHAFL